jgi:hypothetical protein
MAYTGRREKKGNRWYVSVNVSLEEKAIEGGTRTRRKGQWRLYERGYDG